MRQPMKARPAEPPTERPGAFASYALRVLREALMSQARQFVLHRGCVPRDKLLLRQRFHQTEPLYAIRHKGVPQQ